MPIFSNALNYRNCILEISFDQSRVNITSNKFIIANHFKNNFLL